MHSLLVVDIEAVAVDSPTQDAPAALKHKAAARAGEISHSKPTCPLISFISNSTHDHHSDNNFNNNTTISAGNNYIVNGLIAAFEARLTTMQSGSRRISSSPQCTHGECLSMWKVRKIRPCG